MPTMLAKKSGATMRRLVHRKILCRNLHHGGWYPRRMKPTTCGRQFWHSFLPTNVRVHACLSQTSPDLSTVKAIAFR
jgi:hypothetical protein